MARREASAALGHRLARVPAWWADAKLGIFIHWTPASVPGFAPTASTITELMVDDGPHPLSEIPYSEWYENSLRFPGSSVERFHRQRYGDRPYTAFADDFVAGLDGWDPTDWARTIAATGARYVVLVTKHHDGWCLWPSEVRNPRRAGWFSRRDLVGELAEAVRGEGLRFGVYYSGAYDWSFDASPIGTVGSGLRAIPRGEYPAYADAQVRELIDRYRPSVLWNDIGWPAPKADLDRLFEYYFEQVPDGVVNDRWMPTGRALRVVASPKLSRVVDSALRKSAKKSGGLVPPKPPFFQYQTPEYVEFVDIRRDPFEIVRGFDHGFGFNRQSQPGDFVGRTELEQLLVGAGATGGNVMMNIGPRGEDATIPTEQRERLGWLSELAPLVRAALHDTRPWAIPRVELDGAQVRFVARGDSVFAWVWADRDVTVQLPVRLSSSSTSWIADPSAAWSPLETGATSGGVSVAIRASGSPTVVRFDVACASGPG